MVDKNYCVYIHRSKRTNEIFYVGSGRLRRANQKHSRSVGWHSVADSDGFTVQIVENSLTKSESIEKEVLYYNNLLESSQLVNKNLPINAKDCTEDIVKDLYYDETSPTCLRWKNTFYYPNKSGHTVHDVAGRHSGGRCRVHINKESYSIHRVVWVLHYGSIDSNLVVDHRDGDVKNNRISNLRLITQKDNTRNRKQLKNNKSGVPGVFYYDYPNSRLHWRASYYNLDGKHIHKYFSIDEYGEQEAFRLACEHRQQMIAELNAQGAGYTERHGT